MRVKGTCRSANRGGCPFLYARYISNGLSFASASGLLRHSTRSKGHLIRAKSGKSKHLFSCVCVFSGISETKKGKSEIYFGFGGCRGFRCSSPFVAVVVSTECMWCAPAPTLWVCSVPLPCLCPLSCFAFLLCLSNMTLFRVLRGFWRVLGCGCMFVWVEVFALIVGLLCA